jgi:orotidine-5'-phosphate decarboxylase
MQNPIIVALDVDTREKALELVDQLKGKVGAFKVGLELFNSCGRKIIREIQSRGERVFYDAKFHDIPNTVNGAVAAATRMKVWMVNVHCCGGVQMMTAAKESADATAREYGIPCPLVIGVTILTSISENGLLDELGIQGTMEDTVLKYAQLAKQSGLDGVVCSGHEIKRLKSELGTDFKLIVPGIRPADKEDSASASNGDQQRVMTPRSAIESGADYLVIGRPITRAENPADAAVKIYNEISGE